LFDTPLKSTSLILPEASHWAKFVFDSMGLSYLSLYAEIRKTHVQCNSLSIIEG